MATTKCARCPFYFENDTAFVFGAAIEKWQLMLSAPGSLKKQKKNTQDARDDVKKVKQRRANRLPGNKLARNKSLAKRPTAERRRLQRVARKTTPAVNKSAP